MIKNGKGGANTATGLIFERKTDLLVLLKNSGYFLSLNEQYQSKNVYEVYTIDEETHENVLCGFYLKGQGLYKFLDNYFDNPVQVPLDENNKALHKYAHSRRLELDEQGNVKTYKSYNEILSKNLHPDDAFYDVRTNTLHIIEKKNQNTKGSTDEKIRCFSGMITSYSHLVTQTNGIKVNFIYLLSQWFDKPRYQDDLDYIERWRDDYDVERFPLTGSSSYYIEEMPLMAIGL